MKELNVPDMHCEKCVARISTAFKEAKIDCEVNLLQKTVSVEETKISKAIEILDDLGFDVK